MARIEIDLDGDLTIGQIEALKENIRKICLEHKNPHAPKVILNNK